MGTHSLLGFETKPEQIFYQYMQFDGGPEIKGREYYEGVILAMVESPDYFISKSGLPNAKFFQRVRHFLYNYQYASGHSFGNHHTACREEWDAPLKNDKGLDGGQEWQYLFTREGDFIFFPVYKSLDFMVVIPWSFTRNLVHNVREIKNAKFDAKCFFGDFWELLSSIDERGENLKIIRWGKKAPLHVSDEFEYDSSKAILEQVLRGEKPVISPYPVLSLECGEKHAFPEQKDEGWRSFGILSLGGEKIIVSSLFAVDDRPVRDHNVQSVIITRKNGRKL